jgi:hypothetical protein
MLFRVSGDGNFEFRVRVELFGSSERKETDFVESVCIKNEYQRRWRLIHAGKPPCSYRLS